MARLYTSAPHELRAAFWCCHSHLPPPTCSLHASTKPSGNDTVCDGICRAPASSACCVLRVSPAAPLFAGDDAQGDRESRGGQVFHFSHPDAHFSHTSHTPFPHISEINSFFGAESFISPPRHTISPIRRTPLFPRISFFFWSSQVFYFSTQTTHFSHMSHTPFCPHLRISFFF